MTEASTSESKDASSKEKDMMNGWGLKAVEAATSAMLVFGPGVDMGGKSVSFSDSAAMASLNPVSSWNVFPSKCYV